MHVAITGASSGIGEALVRAFAKSGAKLTLVARRRELLEKLDAETGGGACIVAQDLSDPTNATEWIAAAERRHGPIDVLVNNAGMENIGLAATSDPAEGVKLLNLNLVSPLLITRALLPRIIARKSGTIVQVASVAALAAPPGQSWYGASKAGLAMFAETLRPELKGTGVHTLCVYPGPVKTAMGDAAFEKYGGRSGAAGRAPEGTAEELARLVVRAVAKRQARVIYPRFYGLTWWLPWLARAITYRMSPLPK
jgi:short-subunit dehydrogenase